MLKSKCKQLGSKRGHHIKGGAWELDGGEEDETHTVTNRCPINQNLCAFILVLGLQISDAVEIVPSEAHEYYE